MINVTVECRDFLPKKWIKIAFFATDKIYITPLPLQLSKQSNYNDNGVTCNTLVLITVSLIICRVYKLWIFKVLCKYCSENLLVKPLPRMVFCVSKAGLEPRTTCRGSSTSRGEKRISVAFDTFRHFLSPLTWWVLHYIPRRGFSAWPEAKEDVQQASTNKLGDSCGTSALVASTCVVSYTEAH